MNIDVAAPSSPSWLRRNRRWLLPAAILLVCLPLVCVVITFISTANQMSDEYVRAGIADDESGNSEAALQNYNYALLINPQSSIAYYNRGRFYYRQNLFDLAVADLSQSILFDPSNTYSLRLRARIYYEIMIQPEKALADLDRAARIAPNDHDILFWRSLFRADVGLNEEALADINKAIQLVGDDTAAASNYYAIRSHIQYRLGNPEDAFEDAATALELNESNALAYYYRAHIYSEMGETSLAVEDFTSAINLGLPSPKGYYFRGRELQKLGDNEGAKKDFETFLSLYTIDDKFSQYAKEQLK
jgi:tetratricopeptide (TPR) repeat protein